MRLKDTTITAMNTLGKQRKPFLFLLDYAGEQPLIFPLDTLDATEVQYNFHGKTNAVSTPTTAEVPALEVKPIPFATYQEKFDYVQEQILLGNSYLANLTLATPIQTPLSLQQIFDVTKAKYKIYLKDQFTCFSPEIFVQIKENSIYSFPMKGTIDATLPNAKETLLNDPKETAEHYTIVDLIRNDLNIVAKDVRVDRFRYLDELQTSKGSILQMSSQISGVLNDSWHEEIGTIFAKLLPAGSITGSPKERTVAIIATAENYDRNYYTGICGLYDGHSVDSAVMIRFIEQQATGYVYKSGGGITSSSIAIKEYEEILQKIYLPR